MSSQANESETGPPESPPGSPNRTEPDTADELDTMGEGSSAGTSINGSDDAVRDLGSPVGEVKHPVAGKPYNPDRAREWIRGGLAAGSFVLFAIFALGLAWAVTYGDAKWDDVEGMSGTLLPAIVSVVGTTTGFYFGTRSKGDQ